MYIKGGIMEKRLNDNNKNIIEKVLPNSIGDELEIEPGDALISIDGEKVKDIIDYKYLIADEYIVVRIQKRSGELWDFEIEKEYDEDLGIEFTNPLIDKAKSCSNKCIFCFIDQLPKAMRKTLYFKDDDSRLSFLHGNFITLTNLNEEDIDRIVQYRLSPINISVHTTNKELRIKMLRNKKAGNILKILEKFAGSGIEANCQIVLVPDVNDGEELEKTLNDLGRLYPNVKSVALVPVGITKYRDDLPKIIPYSEKSSVELLRYLEKKQKYFLENLGTRFVFPSDEFYAMTKIDLPSYAAYEGFPQLENGVGLMKLFEDEVKKELNKIPKDMKLDKEYIIATGTLAYKFMRDIGEMLTDRLQDLKINVIPIENKFFGRTITVSGLITGQDLIEQLKYYTEVDGIIIPDSMLKKDEDIFLDDYTLLDLEKALNKEVIISEVSGSSFVNMFIKRLR